MIRITENRIRKQQNFWNHCLFHPTDAVEDAWGKRILDRMSEDGAIQTVRIYTMFEDIVYRDEDGKLLYDFRVNDLRLDYLVEKGYDLILAYGGMPDCIARNTHAKTSVSKGKTRYKGKLWNTSPPSDPALWEEICYEYTKHIVERYGIERVSSWHCQCFNEPDIASFFMAELPREASVERAVEYCKMYEAFEHGVRRVSDRICIGGPTLAHRYAFLPTFLDYVKEKNLKLDYLALHNYGTSPTKLNDGTGRLCVANHLAREKEYMDIIEEKGFGDVELVYDEWGASSHGFHNMEESPALIFRETEVYAAYYAKVIHTFLHNKRVPSKMLLCLSGQHEMVTDFSGFRNFFTLNFIKKPIYNAFILASKLGEDLMGAEIDDKNIFVVPTKNAKGDYAVLLSYSSEYFEEDLPAKQETVCFAEDVRGKTVTLYCIDKNTTNPYRLYEKTGVEEPDKALIAKLREEGNLKSVAVQKGDEPICLNLTANCTYLITITE
ncbi:MAG: hypothetical protein IJX28_08830 [Clostridia bacterium]|nr:hypothetical protein [Clostridia bacterium]